MKSFNKKRIMNNGLNNSQAAWAKAMMELGLRHGCDRLELQKAIQLSLKTGHTFMIQKGHAIVCDRRY